MRKHKLAYLSHREEQILEVKRLNPDITSGDWAKLVNLTELSLNSLLRDLRRRLNVDNTTALLEKTRIKPGSIVYHATFGIGIVLSETILDMFTLEFGQTRITCSRALITLLNTEIQNENYRN